MTDAPFRRSPPPVGRIARWSACVAILAGCGLDAPPPARPFDRLIVFGDSLSDTGNIALESSIVPAPPYAPGRFSNGEVWIERVAHKYGYCLLPGYLGGTNFAHGGAETGRGFADFGPIPASLNLLEQVDQYLGCPRERDLIVLWVGANDVVEFVRGRSSISAQEMADHIAAALDVLYVRGARSFLVPNLPDMGMTPAFNNDADRETASQRCIEFNARLEFVLDELALRDGVTVLRINSFALFDALRNDPPPGVTNTADPAWSGSILGFFGGGDFAGDPDQYLFWDELHPTRVTHRFIADRAIDAIDAGLTPLPVAVRPDDLMPSSAGPFTFWPLYWTTITNLR